MSRAFVAQWGGRCAAEDCGEWIKPGEWATYSHGELMHEDCAEDGPSDRVAVAAVRRQPGVCARCWMIHAGECL